MFAGLFRTILYIVGVWFIWRWLDRAFGGRQSGRFNPPPAKRRPERRPERHADDSNEGEYIDYEEVDD